MTKPRGFYKESCEWTKDHSVAHFQGFKNKVVYPVIKICLLVCFYFAFRLYFSVKLSVLLCLCVIAFYQDFVAMVVPNTIRMPAMDHQCFLSNTKAHVNYANVSYNDAAWDEEIPKKFIKVIEMFPKMRYKIKIIFGDYYYEEMSKEETIQKAILTFKSKDKELKSYQDVNDYIADNLNNKLPLDGPLFRFYYQPYNPIDQDHL